MARYTNEYSNFPTTTYTRRNFSDLKDAPASVVTLVEQIKALMRGRDYTGAAAILEDNKSSLKKYLLDATYINTLDEELRNLEIYCKTKKQSIYYTTSEPDGVTGDVWLG